MDVDLWDDDDNPPTEREGSPFDVNELIGRMRSLLNDLYATEDDAPLRLANRAVRQADLFLFDSFLRELVTLEASYVGTSSQREVEDTIRGRVLMPLLVGVVEGGFGTLIVESHVVASVLNDAEDWQNTSYNAWDAASRRNWRIGSEVPLHIREIYRAAGASGRPETLISVLRIRGLYPALICDAEEERLRLAVAIVVVLHSAVEARRFELATFVLAFSMGHILWDEDPYVEFADGVDGNMYSLRPLYAQAQNRHDGEIPTIAELYFWHLVQTMKYMVLPASPDDE